MNSKQVTDLDFLYDCVVQRYTVVKKIMTKYSFLYGNLPIGLFYGVYIIRNFIIVSDEDNRERPSNSSNANDPRTLTPQPTSQYPQL